MIIRSNSFFRIALIFWPVLFAKPIIYIYQKYCKITTYMHVEILKSLTQVYRFVHFTCLRYDDYKHSI